MPLGFWVSTELTSPKQPCRRQHHFEALGKGRLQEQPRLVTSTTAYKSFSLQRERCDRVIKTWGFIKKVEFKRQASTWSFLPIIIAVNRSLYKKLNRKGAYQASTPTMAVTM